MPRRKHPIVVNLEYALAVFAAGIVRALPFKAGILLMETIAFLA
jgi:hypothetical protein